MNFRLLKTGVFASGGRLRESVFSKRFFRLFPVGCSRSTVSVHFMKPQESIMLLRKQFAMSLAALLMGGGFAAAQDLNYYDPNNYSGGYAEGAYSPMGDEQLYPYDSQDQWQHGYIQYMPFYGAYKHFRPYNYKHVSAQTQTAAGWGMSPRLPYSQQFWHRYQAHAKMGHPSSGAYESYLDIPVPQRNPQGAPSPAIQPPTGPQPYNFPGVNPAQPPSSARYAPPGGHPGMSPYAGYHGSLEHAEVSYQMPNEPIPYQPGTTASQFYAPQSTPTEYLPTQQPPTGHQPPVMRVP